MQKNELFEAYKALRDSGATFECITLFIKMPKGEVECIVNPEVDRKLVYIDGAYDDELKLKSNPEIQIEDFVFSTQDDEFDFGGALELLKAGHKVARRGWNGKGQFVYYVPENSYKACTDAGLSIADENQMVKYNHYMALRTVSGAVSTWVPSVTDCLAEDWYLVD